MLTILTVLDLFSGIGGFSLGLERTGGFKTIAFCEIDPFCRRVLAKHWPRVKQYERVQDISAQRMAADGIKPRVVCGGFPCQDISLAGEGEGIEGERSGLWREQSRIIDELRPDYALVENVAALLGRGLGVVLGDLAALGYDAEWHCIPASYVGLRHIRDRVWIVAYPKRDGVQRGPVITAEGIGATREEQLARLLQLGTWPSVSAAATYRTRDGLPDDIHRNHSLGNAVVPQIPELIGRAILEAEQIAA